MENKVYKIGDELIFNDFGGFMSGISKTKTLPLNIPLKLTKIEFEGNDINGSFENGDYIVRLSGHYQNYYEIVDQKMNYEIY